MLLNRVTQTVERADQQRKDHQFVPNPQAPAWAPSSDRPRTAIKADNNDDQEDKSSSGHSGDVVLYTGRGNAGAHAKQQQNNQPHPHQDNHGKTMTTYQGPQPSGPQMIRTPFGIVFGEYPTVEENSRIPGEKMIPRDKVEWDAVDVQRAIAHLYDLCKGYVANCHMKAPPNVPYNKLKDQESYTWHYLMQQVYKDPDHASNHLSYLLSAKAFIPYLLQRTCVDYLLKKLLTPTVFIGFSDSMDNHLRALQGQLASIAGMASIFPSPSNRLARTNQSSACAPISTKTSFCAADSRQRHDRNRQRIIEDHATLIRAIAGSPEVGEFRRRTVDRHANMMSALLEPCRSQNVTAETAAKSIRIMVAACWDISLKVWSSGKTLHYVFPECAHKFSPGTMEALNGHHMGATPEQLVNSQCRVSLVVTPTMTLRDDRDAAHMQCHAIHKAQVLVMK